MDTAVRFPIRHIGFLAAYGFVLGVFIAQHLLGSTPWLAAILGFGLVPVVDLVLGRDVTNLSEPEERALAGRAVYQVLLWAWAPIQLALLAYASWRFTRADAGLAAQLGLVVSAGITTGAFGITIAHELGHRSGTVDKLMTTLLLGSVCYLHFTVEHNRGHHVRVATPHDPATARLGEGFWRFLVRTVPGQYRSAWHLENERLRKRGVRALSTKNRMVWFSLWPLVATAAMVAWLGPKGALFFVGQSLVAIGLLEAVNYLEHYGLLRRELSPGVYERVTPLHSWNASWPLSNALLFSLQRHADHHANAGRRYPILRHLDDGPQLPAGYPTMILLALVPPLWRRVMDPRAIEARKAAGTWA